MKKAGPIGVFDSGYGGLTVLKEIRKELPDYDYLYLGDNARSPYGTRSSDTVYHYTREGVQTLFSLGCSLVILACNTASAKALRNIQQEQLPSLYPEKRVLGVIRPTTEIVGNLSKTKQVGLLATPGTVASRAYDVEIQRFSPKVTLTSEACPMRVPLIENHEQQSEGGDYFIRQHVQHLMQKGENIDTIILACTHYPLIQNQIKKLLPEHVQLISQGEIVAKSLADYLHRHPEIEALCTKGTTCRYLTTESSTDFSASASLFLGKEIEAEHIELV
ncbi:MAG: glutamate racemase [Candidatus Absconditabacteria bacterium]|nr:glutamate racemase [Candidatus Absconditabacteria bacterium]MDD3868588.1 glutamate racemase [Candidatus Absconditabacteria bacterium]MDD4714743.1 glutamate racemase [Candidatus Absconditabacteria bacterium]